MAFDYKAQFIVKPGDKVNLDQINPNFTAGLTKKEAKKRLKSNLKEIRELQELTHASHKLSYLFALQARDAGGKDGAVKTLAGAMNPAGVNVVSFKEPSKEELDHDFLWRVHKETPAKGEITIFNRSHYEDVLIVRVHDLVPRKTWQKRYDEINNFEKTLTNAGTQIAKFYLHISEEERKNRFEKRRDTPSKHWKRANSDFSENTGPIVSKYKKAYQDALTKCSTDDAPWYIIPANNKWFRDLAISEIVLAEMKEATKQANLQYPNPDIDKTLEKKYFDQFKKRPGDNRSNQP